MLGLFHMNKKELIGEVEGSLDSSYYETVLFEILRKTADLQSQVSGEDPSLFSALFGEIPWETVPKRKMAPESWLTSKDNVLKTKNNSF